MKGQRLGEDRDRATGVTVARGYSASGVHCGLRRKRPDLALVTSEASASAAAVFTRNLVQAAPVLVTRENLAASGGRARAIVTNAGNANACTGTEGLEAARLTAARTAELLGCAPAEVIVASTGVIGERLPVDRILGALPGAVEALSVEGGADAARAILTTDTRTKQAVRREAAGYVVGGMAKGSGMIHPDMATTLAYVTTDADVDPEALQGCLRRAVDVSFNRVTVDGDTSTNDMVALLANGASGLRLDSTSELADFEATLADVLVELAKAVARDGEGATRLITVSVTGADDEAQALAVARTIATSPLVKTAVHGGDPNWGRIVAAAGRAGVPLRPELLRVCLSGLPVMEPGYRSCLDEERARACLERDEVVLQVDLGTGRARACYWTCDLSAGYVDINASYRT